MELALYIIAVLGGLVAGFINTLAGSGSAITLSILTELMGLPGNIANGTNRVGILAQGASSVWRFHKNGKIDRKISPLYLCFITIGAILGIICATQISNEGFKEVFKYLLVLMLFVIIVKPSRWLKASDENYRLNPIVAALILIPLGFYGGFIQMGMGVVFLIVLVLLAKYNIMDANILKVLAVTIYTVIALAIFAFNGMVDWKIGGLMALGQFAGGWLGAELGTKWKRADIFCYWLLIIIVSFVLVKLIYQSI